MFVVLLDVYNRTCKIQPGHPYQRLENTSVFWAISLGTSVWEESCARCPRSQDHRSSGLSKSQKWQSPTCTVAWKALFCCHQSPPLYFTFRILLDSWVGRWQLYIHFVNQTDPQRQFHFQIVAGGIPPPPAISSYFRLSLTFDVCLENSGLLAVTQPLG